MKKIFLLLALTVNSQWSMVLGNDFTVPDSSKIVDIEEVVVIATPKEQGKLKEQPSSVSIISQQDMLRHHITSVKGISSVVLNSELQMGIGKTYALRYYKPVTVDYSLLESIPAGFSYGVNVFCGYVNDLKYLFTKEGAKSVGSFGAIGSMFPSAWDWQRFWELTAFISIILAFMNVLPIPALDGGHALFLLLEIVFRRKFSLKFQERAQMVGMWLLLALMVYAIGNDIFRFLL